VAPASPAERAGVVAGDEIIAIDGEVPHDVIAYRMLVDEADPILEIDRGGLAIEVPVSKRDGEALGIEVHSALFDQVRTCDNHCEFCFIYQLPPGMRKSLYLKDDDYRLSFLYGNFTTLTRFTEIDLERVITEGLSPLHVSIHATDSGVRVDMLRNRRGATSLRWLRALLDHGVEVHGQVVVCPGLNDGDVLEDTLSGVLDQYPELASLCVVPLGVSRHSNEPRMRHHTVGEAQTVVDLVEAWQETYLQVLGHRLVFAADEYYLLAERPFPSAETYEGFPMHEDGIGMARTFEAELRGRVDAPTGPQSGFFAWVDGAPAEGYRAPRQAATGCGVTASTTGGGSSDAATPETALRIGPRRDAPVGLLTGPLGAKVLRPLIADLDRPDVRVVEVPNEFFGGNVGVTGLMVGEDLSRVLAQEPAGHRYLLPDVCLSQGRFLDGTTPDDLPRPVEVIATDGLALRAALGLDTPALAGAPR
jgi:putative radical SAM enzyme (TIGR03279 family)